MERETDSRPEHPGIAPAHSSATDKGHESMTQQDPFMTTAQFSTVTGLPVAKITAWLRQGKLKGSKKAGKWVIPADQADCLPEEGLSDAPAAGEATGAPGYSVEQFSEMTYLTPFGVTDWLKKGILTGHQAADGSWRLDPGNLETERVKRLRRC